ncbi:LuxR family transcriptional regulator [Chitinophaga caeni]|uniref:LuxR family transcriptional regulator n=1 Tax=Chitinophaga caeni TaxID=2029983 RepID=A0A291QWH2_9BACT|nr:GIY-YIG nuclease family protein [Chitinophaga caeni]ATL48316.1 LuxR family transcriptional regulator [Chitinophaga caeni]
MNKEKRKILREQFTSIKPTMGVLTVTNTRNNKLYVEGSINIEALINRTLFMLNSGQFELVALQNDWLEFGQDAFVFEQPVIIKHEEDKIINYRKEVERAEVLLKEQLKGKAELY